LSLRSENLVSKLAFEWVNLCRYTSGSFDEACAARVMAGLGLDAESLGGVCVSL
jgi:hypothetical protein